MAAARANTAAWFRFWVYRFVWTYNTRSGPPARVMNTRILIIIFQKKKHSARIRDDVNTSTIMLPPRRLCAIMHIASTWIITMYSTYRVSGIYQAFCLYLYVCTYTLIVCSWACRTRIINYSYFKPTRERARHQSHLWIGFCPLGEINIRPHGPFAEVLRRSRVVSQRRFRVFHRALR